MATTAQQIALEFAKVLREWLSADEWQQMRDLNATSQYDAGPWCASHDFCDSNMAMYEALVRCGVVERTEDQITGDDITPLWNEAWSIAKREYLTATPLEPRS